MLIVYTWCSKKFFVVCTLLLVLIDYMKLKWEEHVACMGNEEDIFFWRTWKEAYWEMRENGSMILMYTVGKNVVKV